MPFRDRALYAHAHRSQDKSWLEFKEMATIVTVLRRVFIAETGHWDAGLVFHLALMLQSDAVRLKRQATDALKRAMAASKLFSDGSMREIESDVENTCPCTFLADLREDTATWGSYVCSRAGRITINIRKGATEYFEIVISHSHTYTPNTMHLMGPYPFNKHVFDRHV